MKRPWLPWMIVCACLCGITVVVLGGCFIAGYYVWRSEGQKYEITDTACFVVTYRRPMAAIKWGNPGEPIDAIAETIHDPWTPWEKDLVEPDPQWAKEYREVVGKRYEMRDAVISTLSTSHADLFLNVQVFIHGEFVGMVSKEDDKWVWDDYPPFK